MFIFNKAITEALNDGYEVAFRVNKDAGPGVLELALRRDEFKYGHLIDTVLLDDIAMEDYIERVIWCGMCEFVYMYPEKLKGENHGD